MIIVNNKFVKLTKKDTKRFVKNIKKISDNNDNECAHSEEDDLKDRFIECCAAGIYNKKETIEIALIILKTKKIKFNRWCA